MSEKTKVVISGIIVGKEEAANKKGDPYFKLKVKESPDAKYPKTVNANPKTPGLDKVKINQNYTIHADESVWGQPPVTSHWAIEIIKGEELDSLPEDAGPMAKEERINEPIVTPKADIKELYSKAVFDAIGIIKDHKEAIIELQAALMLEKIDLNAMSFSIFKARQDRR